MDTIPKSFIGILHTYTDKTVINLNSQSLGVYPIHVTIFNVSVQMTIFLIDHRNHLVGFIPVGLHGSYLDHYENNYIISNKDDPIVHIVIDQHVPFTSPSMGRD